jgi:hypothetical protein
VTETKELLSLQEVETRAIDILSIGWDSQSSREYYPHPEYSVDIPYAYGSKNGRLADIHRNWPRSVSIDEIPKDIKKACEQQYGIDFTRYDSIIMGDDEICHEHVRICQHYPKASVRTLYMAEMEQVGSGNRCQFPQIKKPSDPC